MSARPKAAADPALAAAAVGAREHYLLPGQMLVSREPILIKTILGSCIAVCLWDSTRCLGGINHFLLPKGVNGVDSAGRFGNLALPELLDRMTKAGAERRALTAKVFGGAALVVPVPPPNHIGKQNLDLTLSWLEREHIPVVGTDVGGARGRKLVFNIRDGSASLWTL